MKMKQSLWDKILNKIQIGAAACVALGALVEDAPAQSQTMPTVSNYQPYSYPLTNGVAQGTTVVLGGSTNITSVTNVSILYTNNTGSGNPGFVTNSPVTSYTNIVYPWINLQNQGKVAVGCSFNCSAADTSSKTVKFAYSLDGVYTNIQTENLISWVLTGNGTTRVVDITNFANLGVGYLIPYSFQDGSATGGEYTTNITFYYATKKNAP